MLKPLGVTIALIACALATSWAARAADDRPQWPSEIEEELSKADEKVLELQGELLTARLREDHEAVEKLEKKFKDVQRERVKLLRAHGDL